MPLPTPSTLLSVGFVALPIFVVLFVCIVLRSRGLLLGYVALLALSATLAKTGLLAKFSSTPPPALVLFNLTFLLALVLGLSPLGRRLATRPISLLVGFHSFRVPVELLIHRAVGEGVAPVQMTWTGMNFDIIAGLTALVFAPFAARAGRIACLLWNTVALGLLLWIVGVAALSMPTRFQSIEPDNVWIAHFPFVWLPTILVATAMLVHIALFRKILSSQHPESGLRRQAQSESTSTKPPVCQAD